MMTSYWLRGGLVLLTGLVVGCSAAQPLPTGPGTDVPQAHGQTLRSEAGFHVQQGSPGRPGTRQRQRYCERWQCAFVAREDRDWCMRGCFTSWDLK